MTFRTIIIDSHVAIEISDDGRGVQWDALRERARDAGLACETRDDLVGAMFASKVTTRISVDEIGGRGIGLAAVAVTCRELGVGIEVLTPARGTTFRFHLPVSAVEAVAPPAQQVEGQWAAASS